MLHILHLEVLVLSCRTLVSMETSIHCVIFSVEKGADFEEFLSMNDKVDVRWKNGKDKAASLSANWDKKLGFNSEKSLLPKGF